MWTWEIDIGVFNLLYRASRNYSRFRDHLLGDNLDNFVKSTIKLTKVDPI